MTGIDVFVDEAGIDDATGFGVALLAGAPLVELQINEVKGPPAETISTSEPGLG